jgi:hypothetical protein
MGLAMLGLGFGQRHDYRFSLSVPDLIRYGNLDLVAQIPVTGNVNRLSEGLIQNRRFLWGVSRAGLYGHCPEDSKEATTERTSEDEVDLGEHRAPTRNDMAGENRDHGNL